MKIFDKIRFGLRIPQIQTQLEENKKILLELNWANVFNSTIKNSQWFINKGISPGRWAIGYPGLYFIYRILNEEKPNNILEFGLGESTKMLMQYAQWNSESNVTTIEHSQEWIQIFGTNNEIPENCMIVKHDNKTITINNKETISVKYLTNTTKDNLYDLIIVDAPYGSPNYSRSQILSLIPNNIQKNKFCILIDDYNRKGEKETCKEVENKLLENEIKFKKGIYSGEKQFMVFCSPNLWFLLSM